MRVKQGLQRLLATDPASVIQLAVEAELAKVPSRSSPGWLHISDMSDPCDRMLTLKLLGNQGSEQPISASLQRIFQNGEFMHKRWQQNLQLLQAPFQISIEKEIKKWPLRGSLDVLLDHPEIGLLVIELKSINAFRFGKLTAPLPEHIQQINSYMGLSGAPAGIVWYENKNDQSLKTFNLKFDRTLWYEVWNRANDIAGRLLATKLLPSMCPSCSTPNTCWEARADPNSIEEVDSERNRSYTT